MPALLDMLLSPAGDRLPCAELPHWLPVWRAAQASSVDVGPFAASVAAALKADRLAWAFFSGYQGAIQATLAGHAGCGTVGALCVNETGRKITEIATTVVPGDNSLYLHGQKSWALAGIEELDLWVLARRGDGPPRGPGSLVMVRLPARCAEISRGSVRQQAMVPELVHSEIRFESVLVTPGQLVPGDGYSEYAKPFRMREDVFVTGCTLAYLLAEAQSGAWPTTWRQRCIATIVMLHACSRLDPRDDRANIQVAGSLSFAGDVIKESESLWQAGQAHAHDRWERDRLILSLGKEARRQRAVGSWAGMQRKTELTG